MGFINKTWIDPITLDASNINRLEQGIKNSHDNLEILNEEVANLQAKRINIEKEISKLIKQGSDLTQELTKIVSSNTSISSSNYLSTLEQVLTQEELKQIYSNLKLNNFLKLTDVKVNGTSIITDSVLNISVPIIDQKFNANSTNAISNKAVAEILANFNPDIKVPTKLSDLLQDNDHLTVTAAEKAKWNAGGGSSSNGGISKELDPTVPAWAKEPNKPFYSYSEIIGTPTKLSVFTNDVGFTTNDYVDSEITKLQNILLGPDGDAALDTINELASAIADNSDIIATLNQAITDKAAKDHTHTKSDITDFTHTHGLLNSTFGSTIANTTTDSGWSMIDSSMSASGSHSGYLLKALFTGANAPTWAMGGNACGIAYGGSDVKGVIMSSYSIPQIRFSGGNGSKPVWNITLKGTSGTTYDLSTLATKTHTHAITDLKNSAGNTFTSAKVMTSRGPSGWTNNATDDRIIPTMSVLAYWNGAYNDNGSSNLTRCINGDIVGTTGTQTISGIKTFNAPTNSAGVEQTTMKLKTSNGGAIIFGKEGVNSGTMIKLEQTEGTCRLRFRSSATAGAMVWEQPEQGAQLYIDLGKAGGDYHRISFPSSGGTLALTSQIPSVSGYLPLAGGTMTGQIKKTGVSSAWVKGRDNAMIRQTSISGYSPMLSAKTTSGSWEMGPYDSNIFWLSYITDTNYTNNNNTQTAAFQFKSDGNFQASSITASVIYLS